MAKPATIITPPAPQKRLVSLDQFRGYTVVGMLLVNYVGFDNVPFYLRFTHDYNSYHDTIMPHFLFAVGFSLRLSFGRRALEQGAAAAYGRIIRRLLGLVLLAAIVYGSGPIAKNWAELTANASDPAALWKMLLPVWKREWFQTLLHIAATSLWLVPVIRAGWGARLTWMTLSALAHVWLSYLFNFVWVNSDPSGIDGGPLGFLTWIVPATFGTFACDVVIGATKSGVRPPLKKMVGWSFAVMFLAWVMSCGTRMYDVPESQRVALADQKLAEHPVFPPAEQVKAHFQKPFSELLAEPPFVHPPWGPVENLPALEEFAPPVDEAAITAAAPNAEEAAKQIAAANQKRAAALERYERLQTFNKENGPYLRKWNYWMMSQRGGNLSYPLFAAGFSLLVYVLFYVACDIWGWRLAFFETFGTNALLAYVLHSMVGGAIKPFVPRDAALWYVAASVIVYFAINWLILRQFEKNKWYIRV